MIILLIVFIFLVVISFYIYFKLNGNKLNDIINNEELNYACKDLPNNIDIAKHILSDLSVEDVKIVANDNVKSDSSFYNVISNEITLCNNPKANTSFTRVLFISHECVHAIQDKKYLKWNLILSVFNTFYTIVTIALILINVIPQDLYIVFLGISLVLNMFSYFARNIIESDATYMSINVARNYLKNVLTIEHLEKVINEYMRIISFGFSSFQLGIIKSNVIYIFLMILTILLKCL